MSNSKGKTIAFRLNKSEEDLQAAQTLIGVKSWSGAVNRLYYSAFYVISALLLQRDVRIKSHTGARTMFELHVIKTGEIEAHWSKSYTRLFENRNDSDYEDFAVFTADDVLPLLPQTQAFIDVIKRLITTY